MNEEEKLRYFLDNPNNQEVNLITGQFTVCYYCLARLLALRYGYIMKMIDYIKSLAYPENKEEEIISAKQAVIILNKGLDDIIEDTDRLRNSGGQKLSLSNLTNFLSLAQDRVSFNQCFNFKRLYYFYCSALILPGMINQKKSDLIEAIDLISELNQVEGDFFQEYKIFNAAIADILDE